MLHGTLRILVHLERVACVDEAALMFCDLSAQAIRLHCVALTTEDAGLSTDIGGGSSG